MRNVTATPLAHLGGPEASAVRSCPPSTNRARAGVCDRQLNLSTFVVAVSNLTISTNPIAVLHRWSVSTTVANGICALGAPGLPVPLAAAIWVPVKLFSSQGAVKIKIPISHSNYLISTPDNSAWEFPISESPREIADPDCFEKAKYLLNLKYRSDKST